MGHKKKNNKKRKPHWIYPGDLCWFKKAETKAYPADHNWKYTERITRVLPVSDPVRYVKRTREGRGGKWVHHIEVSGHRYVYHGSIRDFTKREPE